MNDLSVSLEGLPNMIQRFRGANMLVVGDVMVDHYVYGSMNRISPEAPVPIVSRSYEERRPGGAANVAYNLASLGIRRVDLIGVVGCEDYSDVLVDLDGMGDVNCILLHDPTRSTTIKTRIMCNCDHRNPQQVLRIDDETTVSVGVGMEKALETHLADKNHRWEELHGIIVSDYGKGFITEVVMSHLMEFSSRWGLPVFVDPKGTNYNKYRHVRMIKPNIHEAFALFGKSEKPEDLNELCQRIMDITRAHNVLVTLGKGGMYLSDYRSESFQVSSLAKQVADVSGAGDTSIAVYGTAITCGATPREAAVLANIAAGVVVGKPGVASLTETEFAMGLEEYRLMQELKEKIF